MRSKLSASSSSKKAVQKPPMFVASTTLVPTLWRHRMLHGVLRVDGWQVNHKKLYWFYREEKPTLRKKRKKRSIKRENSTRSLMYRGARPAFRFSTPAKLVVVQVCSDSVRQIMVLQNEPYKISAYKSKLLSSTKTSCRQLECCRTILL